MMSTLERALPPAAIRPGLLQPIEVLDMLACRRNRAVTTQDLADFLSRPLEQVLHVVSYMTSLGLLESSREPDGWYYRLTAEGTEILAS